MIFVRKQDDRQLDEKPVVNHNAAGAMNGSYTKQPWTKWLKWGDFLLYGLIGGGAAVMLLLLSLNSGQAAVSAVLTRDGQVLLRLTSAELAVSGETEVNAGGYHYKLVWQDGRVRFSKADCPDKICVQTGWISRPDEIAVCVPGRLILKIVGDASGRTNSSEPDVIVK